MQEKLWELKTLVYRAKIKGPSIARLREDHRKTCTDEEKEMARLARDHVMHFFADIFDQEVEKFKQYAKEKLRYWKILR